MYGENPKYMAKDSKYMAKNPPFEASRARASRPRARQFIPPLSFAGTVGENTS